MIGEKRVLPVFLDMVDDPTARCSAASRCRGHYFVDDEGVKARSVTGRARQAARVLARALAGAAVQAKSNGHGRRERGNQVVARQGNLIVTSRNDP
jgi:TldD protein